MLDFLEISIRNKKGSVEIYPKFLVGKSKDLMIRGSDFYAIWDEEKGLWSKDEDDVIRLVDEELRAKQESMGDGVKAMYMRYSDTGSIDQWHKYVQKQCRDNYHELDEKIIFSNDDVKKTDYASRRLPYPLAEGSIENYDELMSVLYSPEERQKIEWAIGAIVSGDSKEIQKFLVLYGSAGTGKSTVLKIIQKLFDGYYCTFDSKALGSVSNVFALESFKNNPLVAIEHEGDLSRIEDNTRLNSVVSHEEMRVNEKFKSTYESQFKCFLIMATNKPVKITDAKSGIIRRLIDVSPTGNTLSPSRYHQVYGKTKFELGAIAYHCLKVYEANKNAYDNYIPVSMIGATNDFYNFVLDSFDIFEREDGVTLKAAWEMYKLYCDEARVTYPYSKRIFKEELKNYFRNFYEEARSEDGGHMKNYYSGFKTNKFSNSPTIVDNKKTGIIFKEQPSIFDKVCSDCAAQYANEDEKPIAKWMDVRTSLSDLDTSKLHYVKVPKNHIVIDFDIKDEFGNKSFEKNLEAANKWPKTYAEVSKGGSGIHLHYIYDGDVTKLSRVYAPEIEVKVFTGNSSLRRKLSKCSKDEIATLNAGLPLKGEDKKVVNFEAVKSEKGLRTIIFKNLKKEIHPGTKPSVDFIFKILTDAYNGGLKYDVTDLRPAVLEFASNSTHHANDCIKLVNKMPFKSDEPSEAISKYGDKAIIFFDVEVFPNLFVIVYKAEGKKPVKMINPTPQEVEELMKFRLVGFNCRRYDNHILYAKGMLGYNNLQLYNLSQRIITGSKNAFFGEAYNVSYTDVYDFSSIKQSLKKFEIELGIHHQELGLKWDQPVAEEMWDTVADYCVNDVIATEAVFNARHEDFVARQILADLSGLSVNDTTRMHSTKIIFGNNKKPQDQFRYRNLAEPISDEDWKTFYRPWFEKHNVKLEMKNVSFPGYEFDHGVSMYRGEEIGEGGRVYAEPGMYTNVALLDVASMHPNSAIAEIIFGPVYTAVFKSIVDSRIYIKHHDFESAKKVLHGALAPYLTDESKADDLAKALKIVINSVYGYTSASFENPFKDPRNKDNIVAKRGALFMTDLKNEVQKRGFTVAHIKTDSIKIPNATPEIISFVMDFGLEYGYVFEHEATYSKMCLVNDAVYIAKYKDGKHAGEWTATGTQFAVPYVFKTLFSKEKIEFKDLCETKTVSTALYLDMNEGLKEGEHAYTFVGKAGLFCPIKPGCGGGELLREAGEDKYSSATGAKGYRWLESEIVQKDGRMEDIDHNYYKSLVDAAVETISKFGDFEWFVSEDDFENFMNKPE